MAHGDLKTALYQYQTEYDMNHIEYIVCACNVCKQLKTIENSYSLHEATERNHENTELKLRDVLFRDSKKNHMFLMFPASSIQKEHHPIVGNCKPSEIYSCQIWFHLLQTSGFQFNKKWLKPPAS